MTEIDMYSGEMIDAEIAERSKRMIEDVIARIERFVAEERKAGRLKSPIDLALDAFVSSVATFLLRRFDDSVSHLVATDPEMTQDRACRAAWAVVHGWGEAFGHILVQSLDNWQESMVAKAKAEAEASAAAKAEVGSDG